MVGILQKRRDRTIQRKFILSTISLVFGLIIFSKNIQSQDLTSIKSLDSAKIDYKLGRLDKAMLFLDEAEALQASRQIKAEIFLYKARIHSLQFNSAMADFYTKKFVVITPFFKFDEDEQSEILLVARQSKISPRFGLGVSYAMNSLLINNISNSSLISSSDETNVSNFSHFYDFSLGINAEWYFYRVSSIYSEINFTRFNFVRKTLVGDISNTETYFNLHYIQLPIGLKFDLAPIYFYSRAKFFNFYVSGGIYGSRLNGSKAYAGGYTEFYDDLNAISMNNYFNRYIYGYWTSVAFAYRIRKIKISLAMRYQQDLAQVNASVAQYALGTGDELLFNHYQIIDNMYFSNIALQFGATYHIRYKIFKDLFGKRKQLEK